MGRRRRRAAAGRGEDGSALAEFVLAGVFLTLLFLAVLQLGLDYHLRNVLAASAADGARFGSYADVRDPAAAEVRALQRAAVALGGSVDRVQAVARVDSSVPGAPVLVVRLSADLPAVFTLVKALRVSVEGRALVEPGPP